jgi:integrase
MPDNLYQREAGGTWYARFFAHGKLQRRSLKTSDLREARKRFKAFQQKIGRERFGVEDAPIWNQAVILYIENVLGNGAVKPSTQKRYRSSLGQAIVYFEDVPLAKITPIVITDFVSKRKKAGATNATVRRDLTAISRVMAYAVSKGMIPANPVDGYDRTMIRERRDAIKAPSDAAIEAAAFAMEGIGKSDLAFIIRFLRATGMRAGEALRASVEHRHSDELLIPETKNGRARTIRLKLPAGMPIPTRGRFFAETPADVAQLASRWARFRKRLPPDQQFRLHDLRHAFAIASLRQGWDIYDLSHHLGHSSVKVTELYLGYVAGGRAASRKIAGDTVGDTSI